MGLERSEPAPAAPQQGPSFEQFITGVAAAAKITIQPKSATVFVVPCKLEGGRVQNTFVKYLGQTPMGFRIVGFFSPALKVAAGQDLNAKTANLLLRRNGALAHGAWTLLTIEGAEYLGVLDTQIAETMQPAEFAASALCVATAADAMEKELGVDVF